jgi:hypothetical protein
LPTRWSKKGVRGDFILCDLSPPVSEGRVAGLQMLVLRPTQYFSNERRMPITFTPEDILYSLIIMHRISRDNKGAILVCLACTHTERVQDFNEDLGNQRTSAPITQC